ncbi:MAG: hypothetical protein QOK36_4353 [Gaiellales bacterium]|nr:hypothetical protein [Gaiellales bacterium]
MGAYIGRPNESRTETAAEDTNRACATGRATHGPALGAANRSLSGLPKNLPAARQQSSASVRGWPLRERSRERATPVVIRGVVLELAAAEVSSIPVFHVHGSAAAFPRERSRGARCVRCDSLRAVENRCTPHEVIDLRRTHVHKEFVVMPLGPHWTSPHNGKAHDRSP